MQGTPLTAADIRNYLLEVASTMATKGPQHRLLIVGGALLAWQGMRQTTLDVDSAYVLEAELEDAVRTVAQRHHLPTNWVNSRASAFFPQTLEAADCEVIMNHPRLLVLGAPLSQIFVMKMYAARDRDVDDLVAIWPRLELTPEQAVNEYWRAYPAAPADEFLVDWIRMIADRSNP